MIDASYTKKIAAAAQSLFEAAQQHVDPEHRKTWDSLGEAGQREYMRKANQLVAKQGPSKVVRMM